ncbi:hypothetical protein M8C21_007132 [Ambrosia artemisiifolia]|uniref:Large ribosomal subunit protein eL14 domain-containing protein n=1 Tax=Ambrosia artemisiifolia TaxID=4212 RepID=A0AAD5BRG5_AMBAR|nr:hypothetical protein M8C21_007132 [Ambrosia artemisiifolia]
MEEMVTVFSNRLNPSEMLRTSYSSSWGRKLIVQKKRASLNDFERFKSHVASNSTNRLLIESTVSLIAPLISFFAATVKLVRVGHPARLLPKVLESALTVQVLRGDNSSLANGIRKEMTALNKLLKVKDRNTKRDIRKELKMLSKEER